MMNMKLVEHHKFSHSAPSGHHEQWSSAVSRLEEGPKIKETHFSTLQLDVAFCSTM